MPLNTQKILQRDAKYKVAMTKAVRHDVIQRDLMIMYVCASVYFPCKPFIYPLSGYNGLRSRDSPNVHI